MVFLLISGKLSEDSGNLYGRMSDNKFININNYSDLLLNSTLGIFTSTINGKLIEANDAFASMLEYEHSKDLIDSIENISKDLFLSPEDFNQLIKLLNKEKSILSFVTNLKKQNIGDVSVRINVIYTTNDLDEQLIAGTVENISPQIKEQTSVFNETLPLLTLIENLPDYIYFKNIEGELLIANKSVRELIEYQKKILSHSNLLVADEIFQDDDMILKQGEHVSEKLIEFEDSQKKKQFISLSKYPVLQRDKITGLIGIGRNLTDLKQAEKQIIESQANLHALIESSNDFIWSIDTKYRFVIFNNSFSKLIKEEYDIEIETEHNALEVFPIKDREFWKNSFSKVMKGEPQFKTLTICSKNKTFQHFECSFNPIFDKSHRISGISVILVDISERKMAEQAIRESEERFRQLAENTSDAFILWDNSGILYANPAFEKIFGLSIEEAMNDSSVIDDMIAEEDRERFIRNRKKEIQGKQKTRNQQYLLKRKRKASRLIWARHYPVYSAKGKIYRFVTVTSDLTEQKQLEEVLTATRSQQQALLDNIPFLAWLKDKNGRYISVNTPFSESYQLKPEDIIGKSDYDLIPYDKANKINLIDNEIFRTGERKSFEDVLDTINGKEWIEIYKSPIFNDLGEVIGLTGISREITDRKRLEEAILKNEDHFRALLQHSSDAITILDQDGIISFESSLKNRILEFSVEELIDKPFKDIVHPDDVNIFEEAFSDALNSPGIQIKKEYRSLHKNKKWIYVESIFSNHLNNQSIRGIVVNTRDISDRKMSELKEKAYHNNLIFLSNSALELLSISDREDIFRYISEKLYLFLEHAVVLVSAYNEETQLFEAKQITGLEEHWDSVVEYLGRSPIGMTYKRNIQGIRIENAGVISTITDLKSYLASQDELYKGIEKIFNLIMVNKIYTITLARNNKLLGSIAIVTLNKTIIKFKHIIETFAHQVAVALHRGQLEYELLLAKTKAEESDRLKTAFLANMSHEIRTPMNGILGFAEMLNDDSLIEQERKKYLDIINNNGKILINLIDDIIDFAKIEAGQIKIVKHDFSLNTLLNQVYNSFLGESLKKEKSNVKLKLHRGLNDDSCYVRTDPIRLRQIITNLVGNAYKFTSEGTIEFGYDLNIKKQLIFFVRDTGIGIRLNKLKVIFERFVQADNSRSRKYSGSGLGLAISKGFSELLGGTMWAESEENKGSTFFFSIPFEPVKVIKKEDLETKKPKSNYNWKGRKILVAEDDFFSYKFLEGFLKQTNAEILHADDGKKALDICQENEEIDIILMDVQMPEMNGLEATIEIKKIRSSLPIIAQTANAIAEEKQKCFEAGFDDFVTKPINISELFMKIDHWLIKKIDP